MAGPEVLPDQVVALVVEDRAGTFLTLAARVVIAHLTPAVAAVALLGMPGMAVPVGQTGQGAPVLVEVVAVVGTTQRLEADNPVAVVAV